MAGDLPERERDPRVKSGGGISGLVMEGFRGSEILLRVGCWEGTGNLLHRGKKREKCKGRNLFLIPIVQGQKLQKR